MVQLPPWHKTPISEIPEDISTDALMRELLKRTQPSATHNLSNPAAVVTPTPASAPQWHPTSPLPPAMGTPVPTAAPPAQPPITPTAPFSVQGPAADPVPTEAKAEIKSGGRPRRFTGPEFDHLPPGEYQRITNKLRVKEWRHRIADGKQEDLRLQLPSNPMNKIREVPSGPEVVVNMFEMFRIHCMEREAGIESFKAWLIQKNNMVSRCQADYEMVLATTRPVEK